MEIRENLSTPVAYDCDVLVCGGGIAGIAAALAAARKQKKVILLERNFLMGGLATSGLVTFYLALCDGYGHQVSFGIAEELLLESVKYGYETPRGVNWWLYHDESKRTENDSRYESSFNPSLAAIFYEQMLVKAGVRILYGTVAVAVQTENDKITSVMVENKTGRLAIRPKAVVDATGDADIVKFAGVPSATYEKGNVLAGWYYANSNTTPYLLRPNGFYKLTEEQKAETMPNVPRMAQERFTGLDGEELSDFMIMTHRAMLNDVDEYRKKDETHVPVTVPTIPDVRMTRRLVGEYTLDDTEDKVYFEDSVGMVSDWRKRGPVYEIPFRTLYSQKCKNLLCAGRCVSNTDAMWDILRVIPCCAVTGQAAGTAAAMTDDCTTLDITALQKELSSDGVKLHWSEIQK